MIEQGEVSKLDSKNRATVRFPRTSACKNCSMCFKPRDEMFVEVIVSNELNAAVGDTVAVSMGQKAVLGASLIVYFIPVVLVGAILALTYRIDETLSFVFAAVGLVLAEVLIAVTDRVLRKRTEYMPKMVEIIRTASPSDGAEREVPDAAPSERGDAEKEEVGAGESPADADSGAARIATPSVLRETDRANASGNTKNAAENTENAAETTENAAENTENAAENTENAAGNPENTFGNSENFEPAPELSNPGKPESLGSENASGNTKNAAETTENAAETTENAAETTENAAGNPENTFGNSEKIGCEPAPERSAGDLAVDQTVGNGKIPETK